jgi:hypothetical protein
MASLRLKSVDSVCLTLTIALVALGLTLFFSGHPTLVFGAASGSAAEAAPRQPVLVELFTSESCSSCPPADALLARLDATQFVPGAQAIVLSEHVTYWNNLGWQDPFSYDALTKRQQEYAARFGLESVYTPQAVVDGSAELVGSDSGALRSAVGRAAANRKADLSIEDIHWTSDTVHFEVRSPASSHGMLTVALAEDSTQSSVAHGENAGRTLRHVAVVRVLGEMGINAADGRPLQLDLPATGHGSQTEKSSVMRMVGFLTDPRTGRVLAVAESPTTR